MDEDESGTADGRRQGRDKARRRETKAEIKVLDGKGPRSGEQVRKKDFVDQLAGASGIRKGDVRIVLDAALTLIGERLKAGDEIALPPLGRLRLIKERDNGKARIATLRLQTASGDETADAPLAEAGD